MDLNPIKNLWNKGEVMLNQEQATLITGLNRIGLKVLKNITLAYLRFLYELTSRHVKAVADANSDHTKY